MQSGDLPAALDLLRAHGVLSERQHRKLRRALELLERPAGIFRRVPDIDRLGLLLLRGDLSESGFSSRLKVMSVQIAAFWGASMFLLTLADFVLRGGHKHPWLDHLRGSAPLLIGGAAAAGLAWHLSFALPMEAWWLRRRRRLEELSVQHDSRENV